MNKFKTTENKNHWLEVTFLCWRIGLAIIGSYIAVSVFSAAIPNVLSTLFSINKATVFLWMILLSFLLYSLLVLWVISSRHLLKTSIQLTIITIFLLLVLEWSTTAQLIPEISKIIKL
ncbi:MULTISPECIES: hypothetical protein [Pseudoalteromonas]|uniref:hypothetical protein n=1 Tax=Pseudoalteromonas TaxID=53246 RepID=UPI0018676930|nr:MULTISPECIES: hypothetical protein [Pseudoalteromonas]